MPGIDIPDWLLDQVASGKAILFLGSGASYEAVGKSGPLRINSDKLRDMLSDKFLGGEEKGRSLVRVADFCKNNFDLLQVQSFIRDVFEEYQPASFQALIPTFRWSAIFTTNYDLILERAYDQCPSRLQKLGKIIRDNDHFMEKTRDIDSVPFFKLHGCISVINDPNLPLILASEEYARYKKNRERLFGHLQDFGRENPIIFCGYNISDPNIQQILFDLSDMAIHRPHYAIVSPSLTPNDMSLWSAQRIHPIRTDFASFMQALNNSIPSYKRTLAASFVGPPSPALALATTRAAPSLKLVKYLEDELEYVYKGMPSTGARAEEFYRGINDSWGPYFQDLDIYRKVTDDILYYPILDEGPDRLRIALLKGFAGSGKTSVLRRAAIEASHKFDSIVFWLRDGGLFRTDLIEELYSLLNKRFTIFIDDSIPHIREIASFRPRAEIELNLVLSARTSEWNSYCDTTTVPKLEEYSLHNLSQSEIGSLLEKLDTHNCLGILKRIPLDERFAFFNLTAERQLLVALHEATSGRRFEDILIDEYRRIIPREAQILYLDIATLNRLNIGVRAGLISRVSGITFEKFKTEFLLPLEQVVQQYFDKADHDYHYRTRHSFIAQIIFDKVLQGQSQRADQLIRVIRHLNTDYETDDIAFSEMIKGKTLASLFADRSYCEQIYEAASRVPSNQYFVHHQRAIFELSHANGDIAKAWKAIVAAEASAPSRNSSILHTKALVLKQMALLAPTRLEKDRYRGDAQTILLDLIREKNNSYAYQSLAETYIDEIRDRAVEITSSGSSALDLAQRTFVDLIEKAQGVIQQGLSLYPDNEFLSSSDARIAKLLQEDEKALSILEAAFTKNPRSAYLAIRIARCYYMNDEEERSLSILQKCLQDNPASREAHLEIAKTLMKTDESGNISDIGHHLQSSFSDGDSNLEAQFWAARHNYLYDSRDRARKLFEGLKRTSISYENKAKKQGFVHDSMGNDKIYNGCILSLAGSHCLVNCIELNENVHLSASGLKDRRIWDTLTEGMHVRFSLAFNFFGPLAANAIVL
jgi:hypothetical protein